ncbi:hypothetical protein AXYL_03202 [Achromobacter xylosoxidans A8]|uniref:Uncharacterized protein n=1 Tax=Achromobacter xylosoxidans (strain A8) TaxID=762376 RepID=E3HFR6_ACHXA|nr:hypothetical protein [Achromobacter xylosoxidans]ADP16522.1 hypothetical protein AXYL_03202 [Achromobacter xylosoxidans A8]
MSHQLVGKKWQFEIPPLDWKAPETNKEADIKVAAVDADSAEDKDA